MVGSHAADYIATSASVNKKTCRVFVSRKKVDQRRIASYVYDVKKMDDVLRAAIKKSGLSAGQLALRVGVPQQTISEFLKGRDMRLSRAQKLATYFNLELREVKPPKAK